MNARPHRAAPILAVLVVTIGAGCSASPSNADGDLERESSLTSPCGVVVVSNKTDGNYCGTIKVRNNGLVAVHRWSVVADLPEGVRIDFIDTGVTFEQSGRHVSFFPDSEHATLWPKDAFEITYCNSNSTTPTATAPTASSELCTTGVDGGTTPDGSTIDSGTATDSGAPSTDSGKPAADSGVSGSDSSTGTDSAKPPTDTGTGTDAADAGPTTKTALGKYVMTWYSFQDNTPVNSALSASGRKLYPYVSVAVPFRLLKAFGGKLDYGDKLYVEFLDGRTMPNGTKHSGWVEIDDFCGDSGDDSYCFQTVGGAKYPNVDLYIGDYSKSGMSTTTCSGPAGSGQELTNVSTGTPGAAWSASYGGGALGPGKCGDLTSAKAAHGSCWDYTPPASSASECAGCTTSSCTSW
jgi:hypothetical protein